MPRILVFTERLAVGLAKGQAEQLRRWQDRVAARLRLSHTAIREMRNHLTEEGPG